MVETLPRNSSSFSVPDDEEHSTYRWIIIAAKRARQLQGGARPFLPTTAKKSTVIAMEEVRRGLVKWDDPAVAPVEEPQEEA
jgi:DNA-directed RNA polymerase subunit omega